MFKRKKTEKVAPRQPDPLVPSGSRKLNTEFFELVENIPEHSRRRKSFREGTQNARIVGDFKASGFTRGFLTSEQLDMPVHSMGGLVAAINRHARLHDYNVYARLICGLLVLERSKRKATKRSQRVGT